MFKNVVVGIDGRPHGRDAVALASMLLAPDGRMTLAHVHAGLLRPTTAVTPGLAHEEGEESRRLLEEERAATRVTAELVDVLATSPGRGLHEAAERLGADLLVVGSCSRGLAGRVLIGDDARAAMNGAPCAVAVAADGLAERSPSLRSIAVGYDGTPESEAGLATARALAAAGGARILALEAVATQSFGPRGLGSTAIDYSPALLEEAEARLAALDGVEGRAVPGLAGEELAILSGQVDLVIVGSRGYGPVRRLVVGSTSNYLERHARCSLLVLPRAAVGAA
jgi:nucleotide-binding universal stress UspA family protein